MCTLKELCQYIVDVLLLKIKNKTFRDFFESSWPRKMGTSVYAYSIYTKVWFVHLNVSHICGLVVIIRVTSSVAIPLSFIFGTMCSTMWE